MLAFEDQCVCVESDAVCSCQCGGAALPLGASFTVFSSLIAGQANSGFFLYFWNVFSFFNPNCQTFFFSSELSFPATFFFFSLRRTTAFCSGCVLAFL